MTNLEVDVSRTSNETFENLDKTIDSLCQKNDLLVVMKTTLIKFSGSIHWHVKKELDRGTLEVTLWPAKRRLWFSMQNGRRAEWIMTVANQLKRQIEKRIYP